MRAPPADSDMLDMLAAVRLDPGEARAAAQPTAAVLVDADLAGPRLRRNTLAPWEEEEAAAAAAAAAGVASGSESRTSTDSSARSHPRPRQRLLSTASSVASAHAARWIKPSIDSLPSLDAALRSKLKASKAPKRHTAHPIPIPPLSPGASSSLTSAPSTPFSPFTPGFRPGSPTVPPDPFARARPGSFASAGTRQGKASLEAGHTSGRDSTAPCPPSPVVAFPTASAQGFPHSVVASPQLGRPYDAGPGPHFVPPFEYRQGAGSGTSVPSSSKHGTTGTHDPVKSARMTVPEPRGENLNASAPHTTAHYPGGLNASPHLSLRPISAMFGPDDLAALRNITTSPPPSERGDATLRPTLHRPAAPRPAPGPPANVQGFPLRSPANSSTQRLPPPHNLLYTDNTRKVSARKKVPSSPGQQHMDHSVMHDQRTRSHTQAPPVAAAGVDDDTASELLSSPEGVPSLLHPDNLHRHACSERSKDNSIGPPTPTHEDHSLSLVSTQRGRSSCSGSAHPEEDMKTGTVVVHFPSLIHQAGTNESFHTPEQVSKHLADEQDFYTPTEAHFSNIAPPRVPPKDDNHQKFLLQQKSQLEDLVFRFSRELSWVRTRLNMDQKGRCPCCGKEWSA